MNPSYNIVANRIRFDVELLKRRGMLCSKNLLEISAAPLAPSDKEGFQLQENFVSRVMEALKHIPQHAEFKVTLDKGENSQRLCISGKAQSARQPGITELEAIRDVLLEEINRELGEQHLVSPDSSIPRDDGVCLRTHLQWNPETSKTEAILSFNRNESLRFSQDFHDVLMNYLTLMLSARKIITADDDDLMNNRTRLIYSPPTASNHPEHALKAMNEICEELARNGFLYCFHKQKMDLSWIDIPTSQQWQNMYESSHRRRTISRENLEEALLTLQQESPNLVPAVLSKSGIIKFASQLHHIIGQHYIAGETAKKEVMLHGALEMLSKDHEKARRYLPENFEPQLPQGINDSMLLPLARAIDKQLDYIKARDFSGPDMMEMG